ncbi:winged helix-turn-helix transcriptional regulator [Streptomyces sp. NPDC002012]|uniref:winged helix-turn-helix transcriptional regulator n=1 Tax=unclassified Streptomyces TaxID=2593676 RepID=UPI00331EBAD7
MKFGRPDVVHQLTEHGRQLHPALMALARWGTAYPGRGRGRHESRCSCAWR